MSLPDKESLSAMVAILFEYSPIIWEYFRIVREYFPIRWEYFQIVGEYFPMNVLFFLGIVLPL